MLYAGYRFDTNTGLYQVRHRYLNPQAATWLTRDPIGYLSGLNRYAYAANQPISLNDPFGLQAQPGDTGSIQPYPSTGVPPTPLDVYVPPVLQSSCPVKPLDLEAMNPYRDIVRPLGGRPKEENIDNKYTPRTNKDAPALDYELSPYYPEPRYRAPDYDPIRHILSSGRDVVKKPLLTLLQDWTDLPIQWDAPIQTLAPGPSIAQSPRGPIISSPYFRDDIFDLFEVDVSVKGFNWQDILMRGESPHGMFEIEVQRR